MNPTFGAALLRALQAGRNLGPRGMPVTEERVSAVFEAGFVEVNGRRIPVTGHGARGLRPGQKVAVAWQRSQPTVAIRHSARRTGPVSPQPRLAAPVVEELWITARPDDGVVDVWFRNFDQCVPLHVDRWGIFPTSVRWGQANDRLLITSIGSFPFHPAIYYILKFQREPYTGFESGQDAAAALEFERSESLIDSTLVVASLGASSISGSAPGPYIVPYTYIGPFGPVDVNMTFNGSIAGALLDDEGHLILIWTVAINGAALGIASNGERDFAFSALRNSGPVVWRFTVIADNTREQILLSAYTDQSFVSSLVSGLGNPTTVDFTDFASEPTVVVAGPEARTEYATSASCTDQLIMVWPIAISAAHGVEGWIAYVYAHKTADGIGYGGAIPIDPNVFVGTAVVARRAGAMAQSPDDALAPLIFLPMEGEYPNAEVGIGFLPTYSRVVWRRLPGGGFSPLSFGAGSDTTVFNTLFADGISFAMTELADDLENRGTHILPTDFFYLLDDARVTQPEGTPVNFFVDAWAFGGPATLTGITASSELPEDSALSAVQMLADIPTGVARPRHNVGPFAQLQIVNARDTLDPLGRYIELP